MQTTQTKPSLPGKNDGEHGNVSITIDGNGYAERPGVHRVSDLKTQANIPPEYALDQVVAGKIVQLPDDGKVQTKGGEVFISHPKDSASS